MTTPSEAWVIDAYLQIMHDRQSPIDRRIAADDIARVTDPRAFASELRRREQLAQIRAEAEADARQGPRVLCAYCKTEVGWPVPATCPECHVEIGVDVDDGSMFEPARGPDNSGGQRP